MQQLDLPVDCMRLASVQSKKDVMRCATFTLHFAPFMLKLTPTQGLSLVGNWDKQQQIENTYRIRSIRRRSRIVAALKLWPHLWMF